MFFETEIQAVVFLLQGVASLLFYALGAFDS